MNPFHQPLSQESSSNCEPLVDEKSPRNEAQNIQRNKYKITSNLKTEQIRKSTDDLITINVYNRSSDEKVNSDPIIDLKSRNATFLWYTLAIDFMLDLVKMPNKTEAAQKDFFNVLRKYSTSNEAQLMKINDLEKEYKPHKAIWLYTCYSFVYKLLNKCLRENNFEDIFSMRCFIKDLYDQLKEEHQKFVPIKTDGHTLIVYRGQQIHVNELNFIRKNVGKHMLFNNFLSTTEEKKVAIIYAGTSIKNKMRSIIFKIQIDTHLQNTKEYINIRNLSQFESENEVLIMTGSIFKIEKIEYTNKKIPIVHLVMCSDDDFKLKDLKRQIKKETQAGDMSLGFLLYRQGEFEKAKEYFQQFMDNNSSLLDIHQQANCLRGLGSVSRGLKDYDAALSYHQQELSLVKKLNNSLAIAETYYILAQTYFCKKDYNLVLEYSKNALALLSSGNHDDKRVYAYHIMAITYREKQQFNAARKYQQKTLNIQKRLLTKNHPELGIAYQNLGTILYCMENYRQAKYYYKKALSIFHESCQPTHPNIIAIKDKLDSFKHTIKNMK